MALADDPLEDLPLPDFPDDAPVDDETIEQAIAEVEEATLDPTNPVAHRRVLEGDDRRWRIEDDETAEWAGRRLARYDAEVARLDAQAQRWREQIGRWFDRAALEPLRRAAHFRAQLEDYAIRRRLATGEASCPLPSVTLHTRRSGGTASIVDPEPVVVWAKRTAPAIVQYVEKVATSDLRKVVRVEERLLGWDVEGRLGCGHRLSLTVGHPALLDRDVLLPEPVCPPVLGLGELVECPVCVEHSPFDVPAKVPVIAVEERRVTEDVVVGPDGEPVPGVAVTAVDFNPRAVPL